MQPRGGRLESWRRRRGAGQHATQRRPARELAAETRCRATCNPEAPGSRVGGGDDPANTFANTSVRSARLRIEKGRARAKVWARRQRACSRRRINCRRRNPKKTALPQPTAASASLVAPAARASRMARPTDVRRCSLLRRRGPNTTTGVLF
jgi:hypothetical protein